MRIDSITLRNFRRFEHLEATFHPNLNVIVGENGAGKTTVLGALVIGFYEFFLSMSITSPQIMPSDARVRRVIHEARVVEEKTGDCRLAFEGCLVSASKIGWTLPTSGHFLYRAAQALIADVASGEAVLPLLRSFHAKRRWEVATLKAVPISKVGSRLDPYEGCMVVSPTQEALVKWIAHETYAQAQRFMRGDRTSSKALDAINGALRTCMEGLKELYYSIEVESLVVVWEDEARGEEPFGRLSDGQRNVIAMIADLAWRAALLNPQFGAEAAAKTPGVVLIDELELHLHPAWQRRIVSDLRKAFPLVQFFGTTHSPQIISEVPRECLRVLRMDGTISEPDAFIEGRDSNAILEEVMGVSSRPEDAADALDQITAMLDEERFEEARGAIEALRARLGPHDRDLRVAKMRLEMEAP